MANKNSVPALYMRGGTSKGPFFLEKDVPTDPAERDAFLLKVMGSPDTKQINGLGGATSVTSKVAIIGVSQRSDADVDYTFAQVGIDKPIVSYKGNCGNISSAVGPFAIERGLVKITEPVTNVRIHNTNTGKIIVAEVQIENGAVKYDGDFKIAGVVGSGAPIKLKFVDPAGTISPNLLPTGNAVDVLEVAGFGQVRASIVDAANPLVYVKASDLGLKGTEMPSDFDQKTLDLLEAVRGAAAVKVGLITDASRSAWDCPGLPKMTLVAPPMDYTALDGTEIKAEDSDLTIRMMSMQKPHAALAMTGAMCTAAATVVEGSIVNELVREGVDTQYIRLGHPGGILEVGVDYHYENEEIVIEDTFGFRTANLLMDGRVFF